MAELRIRTESRVTLVDITGRVNCAVAETGVESGLCNLFVPHAAAGVVVSENRDPDVTHDLLSQLERLGPRERSLIVTVAEAAGGEAVKR